MGQEYVAVALNGERFGDRSRTLVLGRDHRGHVMGAYAGCNHFGLEVTFLIGGSFVPQGGFQTAVACWGKNDAEKVYFDALRRTNRWRISGDKLTLAGDKDVLEFVRR
jgi:heat shock protein HslJ